MSTNRRNPPRRSTMRRVVNYIRQITETDIDSIDQVSPNENSHPEKLVQQGVHAENDVNVGGNLNVHNRQQQIQCAVGGTLLVLAGFGIAVFLFYIPPVGRSLSQRYILQDDADVYCQNPGTTMLTSSHPVKTICGSLESDVVFVGRAKELADITKRLQDSNFVILEGPRGVGTTALALQYAKSSKYANVICIDAETEAGREGPFRLVAKILKTSAADENFPLLPDGIKEVFNLLECHPTLLIFDGVKGFFNENSLDRIQAYLPNSNMSSAVKHQIKTIVTTHGWNHFPAVPPPFRQEDLIRVHSFNMADCEQYALTKLSSKVPDRKTKWKKLAEYYNCLPLSMRIATEYISDRAEISSYSIEAFLNEVKRNKIDLKSANRRAPSREAKISDLVQDSVNLAIESAGDKATAIIAIMAFTPPKGVAQETLYKISQQFVDYTGTEEFRTMVHIIVKHHVLYSRTGPDGQTYVSMDRMYHEEIIKKCDFVFITRNFFYIFQTTDDNRLRQTLEDILMYLEPMMEPRLEQEDLIQELSRHIYEPYIELFQNCKILEKLYEGVAYPSGKFYSTEKTSRRASKLLIECYENNSEQAEAVRHLQEEYEALTNSNASTLLPSNSIETEYVDETRKELAEAYRKFLQVFKGLKLLENHYLYCRENLGLDDPATLGAAKDVTEYILRSGLDRRKTSITEPTSSLLSQMPAWMEISISMLATNLREDYQELSKNFGDSDNSTLEIMSTLIPTLVLVNDAGLEEAKVLCAKVDSIQKNVVGFNTTTIEIKRNFVRALVITGYSDEAVRILREAVDSDKNRLTQLNETLTFMDQVLAREETICLLQDAIERTDHKKQGSALEQFKLALYRQLEFAGVSVKYRNADFLRKNTKLCKEFKATGVSLQSLISQSNRAAPRHPGRFALIGAIVVLITRTATTH